MHSGYCTRHNRSQKVPAYEEIMARKNFPHDWSYLGGEPPALDESPSQRSIFSGTLIFSLMLGWASEKSVIWDVKPFRRRHCSVFMWPLTYLKLASSKLYLTVASCKCNWIQIQRTAVSFHWRTHNSCPTTRRHEPDIHNKLFTFRPLTYTILTFWGRKKTKIKNQENACVKLQFLGVLLCCFCESIKRTLDVVSVASILWHFGMFHQTIIFHLT